MTTRQRITRDLCGDCWQDVQPDAYFPTADRYGTCGRCTADALVARSRIADEVPALRTVRPEQCKRCGTPRGANLGACSFGGYCAF